MQRCTVVVINGWFRGKFFREEDTELHARSISWSSAAGAAPEGGCCHQRNSTRWRRLMRIQCLAHAATTTAVRKYTDDDGGSNKYNGERWLTVQYRCWTLLLVLLQSRPNVLHPGASAQRSTIHSYELPRMNQGMGNSRQKETNWAAHVIRSSKTVQSTVPNGSGALCVSSKVTESIAIGRDLESIRRTRIPGIFPCRSSRYLKTYRWAACTARLMESITRDNSTVWTPSSKNAPKEPSRRQGSETRPSHVNMVLLLPSSP